MEGLLSLFRCPCHSSEPEPKTAITRPGLIDAVPSVTYSLLAPGPAVIGALTGPQEGVAGLQQKLKDCDLPWEQPSSASPHQHPQSWGDASSLYDTDPETGYRNGDLIADCYGIVTYQTGAVLALADGVNWGIRPMRAASAAVYGFLKHMHWELAVKQGGQPISSIAAFATMREAVQSAQQQVLAADGTLTTLVAALVCPQRSGSKHVMLSVVIGDSPAYVWRAEQGVVEEVAYSPPAHGFHRDPRVCPGCLGYAVGDSPDLSNICYCITVVEEGDMVFLTSDGIADNFDPVMRKKALAASMSLPWKSPQALVAAAARAAAAAEEGSGALTELSALNPAACHDIAMQDMAEVLKSAAAATTAVTAPRLRKSSSYKQQQQPQQQAQDASSSMQAQQSLEQQPRHQPKVQLAAAATNAGLAAKHERQLPQDQGVEDNLAGKSADSGSGPVAPWVAPEQLNISITENPLSPAAMGAATPTAAHAAAAAAANLTAAKEPTGPRKTAASSLAKLSSGIWQGRHKPSTNNLTPQGLVSSMMMFVTEATAGQRAVLEGTAAQQQKPDNGTGSSFEGLGITLAELPGKMDHAAIVAYKVGLIVCKQK